MHNLGLEEFPHSPSELSHFESSPSFGAFAPGANHEAFEFAVIFSAQNAEEAPLAPILSPTVRRQPIFDGPPCRVVDSPPEMFGFRMLRWQLANLKPMRNSVREASFSPHHSLTLFPMALELEVSK